MKRFCGGSARFPTSSQIYSENTAIKPEPTKEDIQEFARRIGIDPEAEPHLLSLAKEGISANLPPNWKPCFDEHKDAWFYYNTITQKSQWTHPMDDIFKERAAQARADQAFNKLQTFDLNKSKPPKALPPLKGFGGVPPGKLGIGIKDSLNLIHQGMNMKGPLGSLGSIKSSGLTITGGGSNFLKTPSSLQISSEKKVSEETEALKLETSSTYDSRPLKSILAKSMSRLEDQKTSNHTWKSENLNDDEFKIWETLSGTAIDDKGRKSNVKFNLEENSELHFDISSQHDDVSPKSNDTGESESEESSEESERIELSVTEKPKEPTQEPIKPQPQSIGNMIRIPIGVKQPLLDKRPSMKYPEEKENYVGNNSNNAKKNFAAGENSDPKISDSNMRSIRAKNEERLQDYQEQLDSERKQKENLLRKSMEASLDQMKSAHEEKLKNLRDEFEREKKIEIGRRKSEFDNMVRDEVNRISEEVKKSIKKKREEMNSLYEKAVHDYKIELSKDEDEKRSQIIKLSLEAETKFVEKEIQAEIKKLKETMKEDQKKQIQQMKDYHNTIIEKMKQDFKREEEELKRDHDHKLASLVDTFEKEKKRRMVKLKNDHEIELEAVKDGFVKEIFDINSKNITTKDAILEEKENEISVLKDKVFKLEEKYNYLKQELHLVVEEEIKRSTNGHNVHNVTTSPTHSGSSVDQGEPDTDVSVSTSIIKPEIPNIMDMIDENHERLNDALLAFENLKEQIVQLKGVQSKSPSKSLESDGKHKGRTSRSKSTVKSTKSTRLERSSSAFDLERLQREVEDQEIEEEIRNRKCIEEAKNFILAQRYRLEHPMKHLKSPSRPNVFPSEQSPSKHSRDSKKHGTPIPNSIRRVKLRQEAPSETESSGVGSLLDSSKNREMKTSNKKDSKQLNKDIDGILDSLKKLDGQMKYLWNVVGTGERQGIENDSIAKEAYLKAFSTLPFRSFSTGGASELFPLNRPSINELAVKYLRPTAPFTTNLGPSFGSSHNMNFNANPIIGPLENQFRDYRLTQNRVMAISEYLTPMDLESGRKTSVVEKTKDLREWLEKI